MVLFTFSTHSAMAVAFERVPFLSTGQFAVAPYRRPAASPFRNNRNAPNTQSDQVTTKRQNVTFLFPRSLTLMMWSAWSLDPNRPPIKT